MEKNKEVFSVFVDGENKFWAAQDDKKTRHELKLAVVRPDYKAQQDAQAFYARTFKSYADRGAMLRIELDDIMEKRGLWNEEKKALAEKLGKAITDNTIKIKKGGCKFKDAVEAAKQIIRDRNELLNLSMKRNNLDQNTAESLSDNSRFNFLASLCTVYNDSGEKFFKNYEDFLEQDSLGNPVPTLAGQALWKLTTGINEDIRKNLPEYQFLLKYKLCNDKLQLLNKEGKIIDLDGTLIDENGRFVNEKNEFVDRDGNRVDGAGNYVVHEEPFFDDDGKEVKAPVVETTETDTSK